MERDVANPVYLGFRIKNMLTDWLVNHILIGVLRHRFLVSV